ncbi:MAG: hypothetical protein Q4D30_04590 [Bacteroidales bacterium]|nr:hypothetical protein [Bacteroidales bacterium]
MQICYGCAVNAKIKICKYADAVGIIFGSQPCNGWLWDAIDRQRAVGTQQIGVAYLKARIQWPLFIQPLTWLATL